MDYDDDRDNTVSSRTGIVARLGPNGLRSRRPEPRPVWVRPVRGMVRRVHSNPEEMMYRSASVARATGGEFTIVATFALLGLALSLLAIGRGGIINPEYMTDLLLLF